MVIAAVLIILLIIADILIAIEFADVAEQKGYTSDSNKFNKYFFYCLFLGLAGWLLVIALPDKKTLGVNRNGEIIDNTDEDELPEL